MTKHAELIEQLRKGSDDVPGWSDGDIVFNMSLTMERAADAIEALEREVEGLRKDAERLDFIGRAPEGTVRMDINCFSPRYIYWGSFYHVPGQNEVGNFHGPDLRAAIDAAIQQEGAGNAGS